MIMPIHTTSLKKKKKPKNKQPFSIRELRSQGKSPHRKIEETDK